MGRSSGESVQCSYCGSVIESSATYCPGCGNALSSDANDESPKRPAIAMLLSVLLMGLGHIYAGNISRGISWFTIALPLGIYYTINPAIVLFVPLVLGVCVFDAYFQVCDHNRRVRGGNDTGRGTASGQEQ